MGDYRIPENVKRRKIIESLLPPDMRVASGKLQLEQWFPNLLK